jgi:Domain of unknown function (DUF5664)
MEIKLVKRQISKQELEQSQLTTCTTGRKFDGGKLQFSLLPPKSIKETIRVLQYGAEKYEVGNWKVVPNAKQRYFDAAMRHLWAYNEGEVLDPETGLSHLAHAICSIMFILELNLEEQKND